MPGWRSIRGRVAVVITVPICLLLVVAGLAVYGRAEALGDARTTRAEVGLSLRVQALVHQLQRERGLTNGLLGGESDFRTPLVATRERVDTALRGMRTERAVEDVIQRHLRRLPAIRAAADRGNADRDNAGPNTADRAATLTFYTTAVDALNAVDPVADTATRTDRRLRDGLAALRELAAAKESVALERGLVNGVFAEGAFRDREYLTFTEVRATRVAALARFRQVATAPQRAALKNTFATDEAQRATAYENQARRGADGSALRADAGTWWDAMTVLVDDLYAVQQSVGDDVRDRADRLRHEAELGLAAYLVAGTLMAALVAGLAAFASRSLTRPLGALAEAAHDVARNRLPATVARIQRSPQDHEEFLPPAEPRTPPPRGRWAARRRSPRSRRPCTRWNTRPSTWPPSRQACAATPPNPSPTSAAATRISCVASSASSPAWNSRNSTRTPSPSCSSSTTSPPACGATPKACWSWPDRIRPGPRRHPPTPWRSSSPPSLRWSSTGGS
ncbi:nitrate- and nitrite sensing domain-containing protein [Streptomyces bobili]